MGIFRVSVIGYEEYDPMDFQKDNTTTKQWKKDLAEAMEKAVDDILVKHTGFIDGHTLLYHIPIHLEAKGYKIINPQDEQLIGGECYYYEDREKDREDLRLLSDEKFEKIIEWNQKIKEQLSF